MKNKKLLIPFLAIFTLFPLAAKAQDQGGDLSLQEGSIRASEALIAGKQVRLYATVKNNSDQDLLGTVKFYDETKGAFIGGDQPVSVTAKGTDEVFVDWLAESVGDKKITARVLPWKDAGDNAKNNKITATLYVDLDADGDGLPNRQDPDDDNDGVNDDKDAFPEDAKESEDTDADGIGNNADDDDDNDNVLDVEDIFPTDAKESKDTDGDAVGDQADAFPKDPKEATDADGDGIGKNKDVNDNNLGPIPKITVKDTVVMVGSTINLDASFTKDPDGKVKAYEWTFGKDEKMKGEKVKHSFQEAGNNKITLKATDNKGESRATSITMTVIHRWQSLPFLIGFGLVLILIAGFIGYRVKKSRQGKKNLPKRKE